MVDTFVSHVTIKRNVKIADFTALLRLLKRNLGRT